MLHFRFYSEKTAPAASIAVTSASAASAVSLYHEFESSDTNTALACVDMDSNNNIIYDINISVHNLPVISVSDVKNRYET